MLNHARSLLANLTPANGTDDYLAEELIEPSFVPLVGLPTHLAFVRAKLFGTAPDRHMVNYRCRQLMTMLHASPLEDHVLALDGRVTYALGEDASLFDARVFTPAQMQLSGYAAPLSFLGAPEAPDQVGVVERNYDVAAGPASLSVEHGFQNLEFECALTSGLSNAVPLGGSGYSVKTHVLADGYRWLVRVRNRPQWDLGQLEALLASAGEASLSALFGNAQEEPYRTYRNLWRAQVETALRLGAVVMAYVHRSNEVYDG